MKKTYLQPTATAITFYIENDVANMYVGSQGTGQSTTQSDDWSNEKNWSNDIWENMEEEE